MLPSNPIANWFAPKTIGYGWTPATWKGWMATLIVASAIVLLALVAKQRLQ